MNWLVFCVVAVVIVLILTFVIYILAKTISKKNKQIEELNKSLKRQKEIINGFQKAEQKAKEQEAKLGHGSTDDRLNASLDILRNNANR